MPDNVSGALSPTVREYAIMGDLPGHQQQPALALGPKGGFMVWHHESGQPESVGRLVIQSMKKSMVGVGLPAPLSQSPAGTREARPCIDCLANGGVVSAWEAGPRSNRDVKVRFISAAGMFTTSAITANQRIKGDQFNPAVSVLASGAVIVSWPSTGQDSSGNGIYAQRFTVEGAKIGAEFRGNQKTKLDQVQSSLAALADGRFVAVWVAEIIAGHTSQGAPNLRGNLMGRIFEPSGKPVGDEYRINHVDAVCSRPAVVALGDGFVVAWEQQDEQEVTNATDIFVRSFDKDGVPPSQEVRWNALVGGGQKSPVLAVFQDNGLLVWECEVQATNSREVHARMLSGGAEFRVNQHVKYNQYQPVVGADGEGNYLVAWVDFARPRNSTLIALQYDLSGKADVTAGNHVSYEGSGATPLVLGAKAPMPEDPVASEILNRNLQQQLSVEFNADEQSRQAALVAQFAAAAAASGLLQQMAAEAQEPATTMAGGLVFQNQDVRRSTMTESGASGQVNKGAVFSNTPVAQANMPGNRGMTGGDMQHIFATGKAALSSTAKVRISGNRAFTPQSTIRRRSLSPARRSSG